MNRPAKEKLAGVRILLTRAAEDCEEWARSLRRAGANPRILACIQCRPLPVGEAETKALREAEWLVLTSRRGVDQVVELATGGLPAELQVAVVGPATAAAAREALGRVDLQAEPATAAGLSRLLRERISPGSRCLLALAENADDRLAQALSAAGAVCRRVNLYRTDPAPPRQPRLPLSGLGVDHVFLASPSAVTGLLNQVEVDAAVRVYSIGPSTSGAAQRAGLAVTAEAASPGLQGLIEAMQ